MLPVSSNLHRVLVSLSLFCFYAFAAPPPLNLLSVSSRVAVYEDINAEFQLVYSVSSACPQQVEFGQPDIDQRQVAVLPVSSISEDGALCTGPSPLNFVGEENIRREDDLLEQLQLGGMREALQNNPNAQQFLANDSGPPSLLVGWHSGQRNCDVKSYPQDTIYFIINEENGKTVSLKKPSQRDVVTVPPLMRALLIIAPGSNICLLADLASNANEDVTITVVPDDGSPPTTTPARPGGSEPTAVSSPTPAAPTPNASPVTSTAAPPPSPTAAPTPVQTPVTSMAPSANASPTVGAAPGGAVVGEATPTASPVAPVSGSAVPTPVTSLAPSATPVGVSAAQPNESPIAIDAFPSPEDDIALEDAPSEEEDNGSACFPSSSTVVVEDGGVKTMEELEVGDRVLTDTGYSDVILFTHRERTTHNSFIRFTVDRGAILTVSPGHYVYSGKKQLKSAQSVRRGENLTLQEGISATVVKIERVRGQGLFNPQTVSGTIIVDGFLASTYTTSVDPIVAHGALMAPVRWMYGISPRLTGAISDLFNGGSPVLARLLPNGESVL